MKYLVALVILAVAVTAEETKCSEERADTCVDSLLKSLLGDTSEDEVCKELASSVACLRTAVDECMGGEKDDEVEEGLEELSKLLRENCEVDDDDAVSEKDDATGKCFAENEEYIYECIEEGSAEALALLIESDKTMDENALTCGLYALVATCFVERVGEKCGEEASKLAEEELKDMPPDVAEACTASEGFIAHTIELLEDKSKK